MFAVTLSIKPDHVVMTCVGSAEASTVDQLAQELANLHASALRISAREVIADIRQLEFATSAGIKEIVTWLRQVLELEPQRRYQVRFWSNPSYGWQRRSLGALSVFARDILTVETPE